MYRHPVYFAETFIDPGRFRGTCYRAANWQLLGLTTGRGKNDQTNKPNRPIKEVLGLPLTPRFREFLSRVMNDTRRRIDVNLEELDQIIDRSTQRAAERIRRPEAQNRDPRHGGALAAETDYGEDECRSAAGYCSVPGKPETGESPPAGHGRNSAAAFTGAEQGRSRTRHAPFRRPLSRVPPGKSVPPERAGNAGAVRGARTAGSNGVRDGATALQRLRADLHSRRTGGGGSGEKYDETAVAMIALLKYGTGMPFQRLERLQEQLGMPLPAATQWDLMAAAAELIRPALEELIRQAAQGSVMHNDDTGMRILRLTREPGDKRTGTFTSGIVSLVGAWTIALFFTGWKHAGENLAEVLKQRAARTAGADPDERCAITQHAEGGGVEPLQANCLAHGRRQVVEVADNFPEECRYVLETLGDVYHHDALAREQSLSPEQRLRFHQEHSGPLMKGLHDWMEAQLSGA